MDGITVNVNIPDPDSIEWMKVGKTTVKGESLEEVQDENKDVPGDKSLKSMRVKVLTGGDVIERKTDIAEATKRLKAFDEYDPFDHIILGVPFGGPVEGRDAEGEAFTKSTDIWLKPGDTVPLTYYHGFGPDDPETLQDPPAIIGRAKYMGADKRGHWFEPRLDAEEELTKRLTGADVTALRASSGAVSHLVRMKAGGLIDVWPVGELAVFDVNDWRIPANDYAVFDSASAFAPKAQAKGTNGTVPPDATDETDVATHKTLQRRALQLLAKLEYEGV